MIIFRENATIFARERPKWVTIAVLAAVLIASAIVFLILFFPLLAIINIVLLAGLILYSVMTLIRTDKLLKENTEVLQGSIEKNERYLVEFSHRIRTPLNNLTIINDLLIETNLSDAQKNLIESLIASTNNMVDAMNELSIKSASDISTETRSAIPFDLIKTIDSTRELIDLKEKGNVSFKVEKKGSIKEIYNGDPISIKQILIDLFNLWNIDKNEMLNVELSIEASDLAGESDLISFRIGADRPFNNISTSDDHDFRKNSLAVRLIEMAGGSYSYESAVSGSAFSFRLTLAYPKKKTVTEVAQRIGELETVTRKQKQLSDLNLLLVEDNEANQKIVQISLGSKVKNIDIASNGKQALDMFGKANYDIILMDIQLPIMDGIVASQKIREIESSTNKHTPIIAITANAMIGDKEKCLSAGIDDYMSKPYQPGNLIEIISKYI